jgi:hypothetical protein
MSIDLVRKLVVVADHPTDITGRIYPYQELLNACESHKDKELLGSFVGISTGTDFDLSKTAIKCKNLRMEGTALVADFTILDTHYGVQLQKIVEEHQMVLSPRGVGEYDSTGKICNYTLLGIDVRLC